MAHHLDLDRPAPVLTADLCDISSVSGAEAALADAVQQALSSYDHLKVDRDGDAVVARTELGHDRRVVIAGHLDTVPVAGNLPTHRDRNLLWGRGTVDMKGGVAAALRLAAHVVRPMCDVTYVFYDNEEVAADRNGLGRIARAHPEWLAGEFAVLMEPTSAAVEGGCNGTLRADITIPGRAAHSARWWMGSNAIHAATAVLQALSDYRPREVEVDGLIYREGLNAVAISGGIAGNVIPDSCMISVNYRFAPSMSVESAFDHVRTVVVADVGTKADIVITLADAASGARPGLDRPVAKAFIQAVGGAVRAKEGWTDVARFTEIGIPAVNYGPGDPLLAHADDERVDVNEITHCEERMRAWLAG